MARKLVVWFWLLAAPASIANEWPQWRGPDRTGVSLEDGWEIQGKTAWEAQVGLGYSTVSIADGRLYTLGFDQAGEQDVVVCLDADTGEEIWDFAYPAKIWNEAHKGGTLTTPSIDGDQVYLLNREGEFYCFDAESGKVRWKKDLRRDLGVEHPRWGFAASPLVLDDMVVLNLGTVLAVDKKSGKAKWKSKNYGHAYSTPATLSRDGEDYLAVFNGGGLVVLDQKQGKEHGHVEWKTSYDVNAATPVVAGDRIFISSGYNHGCAMVEWDAEDLSIEWESKDMRNHMAGCVLFEDHLYGFDDSTFRCLDLQGNTAWQKRGLGKGAHLVADGRLLLLTGDGELVIAEATPDGYEEHAREKLFDGGVFWTTPVVLDGRIYCRSSTGHLICRDHRASGN